MARTPVLFDTDIGSDIDDAVALAYLLAQPDCELLGITTVTGQPEKRAMLVDAVCGAFGRNEVLIFAGAASPMLIPSRQPEVPQAAVLDHWPHRTSFVANTAVDFLRETIRSRPGEIVLLSVGAQTNVALLYAMDPQIPTLLKAHVIMGGLYTNKVAGWGPLEWNIIGDPHAAEIVYKAPVPKLTCIGLDVTSQCRLPLEQARQRFSQGRLKIIGEMANVWFRHTDKLTFHDPLAAAVVFDPTLCTYTPGRVDVELISPRLMGFTHFDRDANEPRSQIATAVDPKRFFDHYFAIVTP
jgi:purine nucleosidase